MKIFHIFNLDYAHCLKSVLLKICKYRSYVDKSEGRVEMSYQDTHTKKSEVGSVADRRGLMPAVTIQPLMTEIG